MLWKSLLHRTALIVLHALNVLSGQSPTMNLMACGVERALEKESASSVISETKRFPSLIRAKHRKQVLKHPRLFVEYLRTMSTMSFPIRDLNHDDPENTKQKPLEQYIEEELSKSSTEFPLRSKSQHTNCTNSLNHDQNLSLMFLLLQYCKDQVEYSPKK